MPLECATGRAALPSLPDGQLLRLEAHALIERLQMGEPLLALGFELTGVDVHLIGGDDNGRNLCVVDALCGYTA